MPCPALHSASRGPSVHRRTDERLTSLLYDPVSTHCISLAIVPQEYEVILGIQLDILHEGVVLVHPHRRPCLQHTAQGGLAWQGWHGRVGKAGLVHHTWLESTPLINKTGGYAERSAHTPVPDASCILQAVHGQMWCMAC